MTATGWVSWFAVGLVLGLECGTAGQHPNPPAPPAPLDTAPAVFPAEAVKARLAPWLGSSGAAADSLTGFYRSRGYHPAWSDDGGMLPAARELLVLVSLAGREGLDPGRYPLDSARELLQGAPDPAGLARLDVLLSRIWLSYARDVALGRVDPAVVDSEWRRGSDLALAETLRVAVAQGRSIETLRGLVPPHEGYARLRDALEHYQSLAAAPWRPIGPGPATDSVAAGPRVAALRERLTVLGDLGDTVASDTFDAAVDTAVRRFQARHGLSVDGVVGDATLAALDIPPATRVRQIAANLERWRWLPRDLGERHILVNAAAFALELAEQDRVVLERRVVVGRPDWPTPIVSGPLTHVVLNPAWHVPRSIAVRDLLPLVRADRGYLRREGIQVWSGDSQRVDPDSVNWRSVRGAELPYRFVQAPGPRNALGRVKFVFDNPFEVYLHDTPAPSLFAKCQRAFSHGCIRVQGALELAVYLLGDQPRWSRDAIRDALDDGEERWVAIRNPVRVHLVHLTAWVRSDGVIEFRDDVYGWDARLLDALRP